MEKKEPLRTGDKKEKTGNYHANSTSFKPKQSGNPGGRPKKTEEQIAQDKQIEDDANKSISMLAGKLPLMTDEIIKTYFDPATPASVKKQIWEASMDRVYGKAFQSVQIDTGANDVHVTTDAPTEVLSK